MKRKLFTSLICVLLCGVMLFSFASCGKDDTPDTVDTQSLTSLLDGSKYKSDASLLASGTVVSSLDGLEEYSTAGDLLLFRTTVNGSYEYTVYNLATNAVVLTVKSSELDDTGATERKSTSRSVSLGYSSTYKVSYFTVTVINTTTDKDTYKTVSKTTTTTLYNATGSVVATANGSKSVQTAADLLIFDNTCYRMSDDGTFASAFTLDTFATVPQNLSKVGDYYVSASTSGSNRQYVAYNNELKVVATYALPSYATVTATAILENGNILLQYTVRESDDADCYTYVNNGTKYTLKSVLLNVKDNEAKEIDLDYYLVYGYGVNQLLYGATIAEIFGIKDSAKNVAIIAYIEDKHLNTNEYSTKLVTLNNDGSIVAEIKGIIDNQDLSEGLILVAENRWIISDLGGQDYLINEKGEVLGNVTNANFKGGYIYGNGKVYDYNMNLVIDYAKDNLTLVEAMNRGIIFRNVSGEIIFFTNGTKTTIIPDVSSENKNVTIYESNADYFIARQDGKYYVYNDKGVKLADSEYSFDEIHTSFGGTVLLGIGYYDNNIGSYTYKYYRLSK